MTERQREGCRATGRQPSPQVDPVTPSLRQHRQVSGARGGGGQRHCASVGSGANMLFPPTSHVTLGSWASVSLSAKWADNNSTYLMGLVGEFKELMQEKHLDLVLSIHKSVRYYSYVTVTPYSDIESSPSVKPML